MNACWSRQLPAQQVRVQLLWQFRVSAPVWRQTISARTFHGIRTNCRTHVAIYLWYFFKFIFRGRFKQRNIGGVNAPLTHTVPTRLHTVYYTSVDCNPLSTSVCSKFVIQLVPSVLQQLTRFRMRQHAWRGPSAVAELLVYTAYNMAKDADVMFRSMSSLYCIVCCCLVLLHGCYVCITLSHVYIYVVIPELNYSGQPFTMSSA